MRSFKSRFGWVVVAALLLPGGAFAAAGVFTVDPTASLIEVRTGKAGLFGGMGHAHRITSTHLSGTVTADPGKLGASSVDVTLDAGSLKVVDNDKPSDLAEIQHNMQSDKGLDVAKFASIRFQSTGVSGSTESSGVYKLALKGNLELHGVTKELQLPVEVTLARDELKAHCEFVVKQRDFGISPFSAGMGTVKVANEVKIRLDITARRKTQK